MTEEPLISIVMPAYNAEETIRQAIQSVIDQTYRNWELLVIDDCSKDHTLEKVRQIVALDERIHLFKNPQNSGVSATRNLGISESKGSWIAFLDSDDIWREDKLQKQTQVVRENPEVDLVFTGSSFISAQGSDISYELKVPSRISYRRLLKQNLISCSSVLIRKTWVQKYPMKYDGMHEDYAVWLQILRDGGKAYGINEPLLKYRLSVKSKSSNKKKAAIMTYKVYRYLGLNLFQTSYYFCWYAWKNLRKYQKIYKTLH